MDTPPINTPSTTVTQAQYEAVCRSMMPKLLNELPSFLTYHNVAHIQGVMRDADYLLQREGVLAEDRWLILTAALWHDAGFLKGYKNHEAISCELAGKTLPAFGYSAANIDAICEMIMATRLPQSPHSPYAMILCDADLFYLGTDDFFATADNLFQELKNLGLIHDKKAWDEKQLQFLQSHCYFTQTATSELEPKKKRHIDMLLQAARANKL